MLKCLSFYLGETIVFFYCNDQANGISVNVFILYAKAVEKNIINYYDDSID